MTGPIGFRKLYYLQVNMENNAADAKGIVLDVARAFSDDVNNKEGLLQAAPGLKEPSQIA